MYAVIRAGGKQYRVAPGDVIRVETSPATDGKVEFRDVLAVSGQEGHIGLPHGEASVVGTVVQEGRAEKILVFHYKRKKQYKKLRGHRQAFTAVRITEIAFDGQRFTAPELEKKVAKPRPAKVKPAPEDIAAAAEAPEHGAKRHQAGRKGGRKERPAKPKAHAHAATHAAAKKPAPKKAAHHKPPAKKGGGKKKR